MPHDCEHESINIDSKWRPGTMVANPIRMARIQNAAGTLLMVPLDHGVSIGPVAGIEDPRATLEAVAANGATCVTLHKGLVRHAAPLADRLGILLHLSASDDRGPDPNDKRLVATVEEALRLGCDGVSIHVNVGDADEADMIEDAGAVATACHEWSVPLVAMMYPRGEAVDDPFDPVWVAHAARMGAELGADAVKVPYTGDPDTFRTVVRGATVPVVVAGGPKQQNFDAFLEQVTAARDAGAAGVSIGRNVFQHPQPGKAMAAIADLFP